MTGAARRVAALASLAVSTASAFGGYWRRRVAGLRAAAGPAAPAGVAAPRPARARKPRVLLLTPFLPAPPVDGGKKRVHTLLRLLADRYDFTLLSFVNGDDELWHVPSLKKLCRDVIPVRLEPDEPAPPDDLLLPQIAKSCHSRRYAEILQSLLREDPPDLVHVEFLQMGQYRRYVRGRPVVYTEHDVSNISFFRSYFREMTGWQRWGRLGEWARLVRYQMDVCRSMDGVVTLTAEDDAKLRAFLPSARLRLVNTGVDLGHFRLRPRAARPSAAPEANIVFVGHYLHYPNEDAILSFHREVWPRLVRLCPIARLWVVGSAPTPAVRRLAEDPRVRVTDTVPDVRPYLEKADVFVAPMRLGEGIKGKILEAFATGVPVVTTPRGAHGLEARDGEEFCVARGADDFAERTARLVFDGELRTRLVRNARRLAERTYDWRRLADRLDDFYRETLASA
jgi:glycosyltransferase involved in cell wall biosynthesis